MVRSTIKETFLTEPRFTKFIADNEEVATRLLDAVDMSMNDDYKIVPEDKTVDNKRVDLTINDSEGTTVAVIEAQDATGWLDSVHASKIGYYCWEKECFDAILITEDASERIKDYVKWLNTHPDLNIYLVATTIYKTDDKPFVDFVPIMRPKDLREKVAKRNGGWDGSGRRKHRIDVITKLSEENPGEFTNVTSSYASNNDVSSDFNLAIHPRKNSTIVNFYHGGKLENDEKFENKMKQFGKDSNCEPSFSKVYCRFIFGTPEKAMENFKMFKEAL
jgi:hypothetical protein